MLLDRLGPLLLLAILSILSGLGDAQGFIHASNIWQNGRLVWVELGKSAVGFGFGILCYWIVLRYMRYFGIVMPEVQTIIWFAMTLIGVALASGRFFKWQFLDQVVAVGVLAGIAWILIRTSHTT